MTVTKDNSKAHQVVHLNQQISLCSLFVAPPDYPLLVRKGSKKSQGSKQMRIHIDKEN